MGCQNERTRISSVGEANVTAALQTSARLLNRTFVRSYVGLTGMTRALLGDIPFVVVDLETTGGSAVFDRVLENLQREKP